MKAVVAIAVASLLGFSGCGKIQAEKLPGSWQLTKHEAYFKSKAGESHSEKEVAEQDSFQYVFDQGKMYVPGKNAQPAYQGSYQQDGDHLVVQGNDKSNYEFKIAELNEEKLKLEKKTEQGDTEERIVLTFQRIGGYNNSGSMGNQPANGNNYGNPLPQQPYNQAPNSRMPAPTGNNVAPRV